MLLIIQVLLSKRRKIHTEWLKLTRLLLILDGSFFYINNNESNLIEKGFGSLRIKAFFIFGIIKKLKTAD